MRTLYRPLMLVGCVLATAAAYAQAPATARGDRTQAFSELYTEYCAVCHGADLTGEAQGTPLVGVDLMHGDSVEELSSSPRAASATSSGVRHSSVKSRGRSPRSRAAVSWSEAPSPRPPESP